MQREGDALVLQLPRTAGRKDSEYMHLFSGSVDLEAYATKAAQSAVSRGSSERVSLVDLEQRVTELEAQVAELRSLLE